MATPPQLRSPPPKSPARALLGNLKDLLATTTASLQHDPVVAAAASASRATGTGSTAAAGPPTAQPRRTPSFSLPPRDPFEASLPDQGPPMARGEKKASPPNPAPLAPTAVRRQIGAAHAAPAWAGPMVASPPGLPSPGLPPPPPVSFGHAVAAAGGASGTAAMARGGSEPVPPSIASDRTTSSPPALADNRGSEWSAEFGGPSLHSGSGDYSGGATAGGGGVPVAPTSAGTPVMRDSPAMPPGPAAFARAHPRPAPMHPAAVGAAAGEPYGSGSATDGDPLNLVTPVVSGVGARGRGAAAASAAGSSTIAAATPAHSGSVAVGATAAAAPPVDALSVSCREPLGGTATPGAGDDGGRPPRVRVADPMSPASPMDDEDDDLADAVSAASNSNTPRGAAAAARPAARKRGLSALGVGVGAPAFALGGAAPALSGDGDDASLAAATAGDTQRALARSDSGLSTATLSTQNSMTEGDFHVIAPPTLGEGRPRSFIAEKPSMASTDPVQQRHASRVTHGCLVIEVGRARVRTQDNTVTEEGKRKEAMALNLTQAVERVMPSLDGGQGRSFVGPAAVGVTLLLLALVGGIVVAVLAATGVIKRR